MKRGMLLKPFTLHVGSDLDKHRKSSILSQMLHCSNWCCNWSRSVCRGGVLLCELHDIIYVVVESLHKAVQTCCIKQFSSLCAHPDYPMTRKKKGGNWKSSLKFKTPYVKLMINRLPSEKPHPCWSIPHIEKPSLLSSSTQEFA